MSILTSPENPFDFFNVRFPRIAEFGDRQLKAFWLPSDIDYSSDGKDFESLDRGTQKMIEMTIGFFFSSDGIVFRNIGSNFKEEIKSPEVQYVFTAIETIELIHAKSYGMQLDSIISDPQKKEELMKAIVTIPSINLMAEWAQEHTDPQKYSLMERLVAVLCVEGIFFSSPFAFIFWLRKYHPTKLKGIVGANDLISRDENLHCEYGAELINTLQSEGVQLNGAAKIFLSAVDVALRFVKDTLSDSNFMDMNVELMSRHVKSVANRWASLIGLSVLFPDCKQTPFKFIENIALDLKKNFFEKTATEYQKAPVMAIDFTPDLSKPF